MQALRACLNAVRGGIFSPQPALRQMEQIQRKNIGTVAQGIYNGSSQSPTLTSLLSPVSSKGNFLQGSLPTVNFARSIIRIRFPRPRENKRINVCGFKKRMSMPSGRRIIMKRIIKGRHSLSN